MQKDYLAIELAKIEADAAALTEALLKHQDAFLRGHALAELLKAHGAPAETNPTLIAYNDENAAALIYCTSDISRPVDVLNALQDTRLPYRITAGYNEQTRIARVDGYEGMKIALPAALFPALQEAA